VYYYQARAILDSTPSDLKGAEEAIAHALTLTADDPYIFVLAGKISFAEKNYSQALQRLTAADRLQPKYIPTHYALRDTYKAMGDERSASAELDIIKNLAKDNPGEDTNPFALESFLFSVRSSR
jgi:predicted Zn-dependent protease